MEFPVYGLSNTLVDISAPVSDSTLEELRLPKGSVRGISPADNDWILKHYAPGAGKDAWTAAGSVANSVVVAAELSGKAALGGRVGDDIFGDFYRDEVGKRSVHFGNPPVAGGRTGTVICLVTPDGERTMPFTLGTAADFSKRDVERPVIQSSQWLLIEAYLLANGAASQEAVRQAMLWARAEKPPYRAQTALSLSAPEMVNDFREIIDELIPHTDLLIGNRSEAMALTGALDLDRARRIAERLVPNYVITDGPGGAYIRFGGREVYVPGVRERVDATGAGDTFAGGFLYGITHGCSPEDAARGAAALAAKVIKQYGARLPAGKARWAWDLGTQKRNAR